MQNQICIVTGANGFVGRHLCAYYDRIKKPYRACLQKAPAEGPKSSEFITGDLSAFENWKSLFEGADTVLHLAAKAHDMSNPPIEVYRKINVEMTKKVAQSAKKYGVKRFVFLSSVKVNGEETTNQPFRPEDTPHPQDPYGISKYEAEVELLKMHEPGFFEVVIVRPTLIYGPNVKANFQNLINLVKKKLPLPFGCVHNKRSFLSIENLNELLDLCTVHPSAGGRIFLASDDDDQSLSRMIRTIAAALRIPSMLIPVPVFLMKAGLALIGKATYSQRLFGNLQVDVSKTKAILGWTPHYKFKDGINLMLGNSN